MSVGGFWQLSRRITGLDFQLIGRQARSKFGRKERDRVFRKISVLMATPSRKDVTDLLIDWGKGDQEALKTLMPLVYDELHRLAEPVVERVHRHRHLDGTGEQSQGANVRRRVMLVRVVVAGFELS